MIAATVREWHDEDGWGVVDAPETPGGCWVHYSQIDAAGCASLTDIRFVRLEYEAAQQDGYLFRAVRVEIPGRALAARETTSPAGSAYKSRLRITRRD